jgi:hypothetical protein
MEVSDELKVTSPSTPEKEVPSLIFGGWEVLTVRLEQVTKTNIPVHTD